MCRNDKIAGLWELLHVPNYVLDGTSNFLEIFHLLLGNKYRAVALYLLYRHDDILAFPLNSQQKGK